MKNRFETLRVREVPAALDRRIMTAAALKARAVRVHRLVIHCFVSAGAAAAALLVAGTLFLMPGTNREQAVPTRPATQKLLAMAEWSSLEQESYNLSFELYSGRQSMADLGKVKIQEGY